MEKDFMTRTSITAAILDAVLVVSSAALAFLLFSYEFNFGGHCMEVN